MRHEIWPEAPCCWAAYFHMKIISVRFDAFSLKRLWCFYVQGYLDYKKKRFVGAVSVPCRFVGLTINHKDLIEKRVTFFTQFELTQKQWFPSNLERGKDWTPAALFSPLLSSHRALRCSCVIFPFSFFCVNLPLQLPCDWLSGKRAGHKGLSCAPVFLGDGRGHLNG